MSDWYRVSRPLGAIDPDERGFQYGDGVFETVAVRKGEPRLWSHHVRRLERGCKRIGFERPTMIEPYVEIALAETRQNRLQLECFIGGGADVKLLPEGYVGKPETSEIEAAKT